MTTGGSKRVRIAKTLRLLRCLTMIRTCTIFEFFNNLLLCHCLRLSLGQFQEACQVSKIQFTPITYLTTRKFNSLFSAVNGTGIVDRLYTVIQLHIRISSRKLLKMARTAVVSCIWKSRKTDGKAPIPRQTQLTVKSAQL